MDAPFPAGMVDCIRTFFERENTREPGLDLYNDVFITEYMFPLQRKAELAKMMREARRVNPKVVYEIGADKAGGLYHWCKSLPTVERVIACEIRGTPYNNMFEKAFPHIDFLWLEESSYGRSAVEQVRHFLGTDKLDCLFIDGDKSHFHTDFAEYSRLVASEGVVFMHDITDEAPGHAFELVSKDTKYDCSKLIIDRSDWEAEEKRQLAGEPARCNYEHWLRYWKGSSCGVGVIRRREKARSLTPVP